MTKTIEKVRNNEENPENFDVFYKENNEIRKNISINEIFQGDENIVSAHSFEFLEADQLVIPKSVTRIHVSSFRGAKIKELLLPDTIKELAPYLFNGFKADQLVIPIGVDEILSRCFYCAKIKELILPDTIKRLAPYSFEDFEADKLVVPESVKTIHYSCFRSSKIKLLKLPSAIETIEDIAFKDAEIDTLYIKNVSSIGEGSFDGFQGMIFTDNSESKAKFVTAGLDPNKVVDLSSRKERFEALKNKTPLEIRELEKDLNIDLWDKNYMQPIEGNLLISDEKGKKFNLPGLAMSKIFQHLTLGPLDQFKNDFSNNLKKESKVGSKDPESMGKQSMFNSNINRDPGRQSKLPQQSKPRKS